MIEAVQMTPSPSKAHDMGRFSKTDDAFATSTTVDSLNSRDQMCICYADCGLPACSSVSAEQLIVAADSGDLHYVRHVACAVREGIVSVVDEDGMTAMHVAAQRGHLAIVRFLLKSIGTFSTSSLSASSSAKTAGLSQDISFDDLTDRWAVGSTSASTESATTSSGTPQSRSAPTSEPTSERQPEKSTSTPDIKCSSTPSVWAEVVSRRGHTALHWASMKGHVDVTRELLKAGFNINAKSKQGATPLQLAVAAEKIEIVRLLVRSGADSSISTTSGSSPDSASSFLGNLALVDALRGDENFPHSEFV